MSDTRLTPYALVFTDADFEADVFPAIQREAESQGVDPGHRERFAFLTVASDTLREIAPEDAPPGTLEQLRALLFHGFNFWRFGRRNYRLDAAVARYLVEGRPVLAGWDLRLPHPAIYLQLPPNLFWATVSPDAVPEPVDGFFATEMLAEDSLRIGYRHLQALMVLGMRRDRAGFSVIPFETETGMGMPAGWAEAPGRDGGRDFASVLPGGEMAGLYSILTTGEALKLLARGLWYIDRHPQDVHAADGAAEHRVTLP